MPTGIGIKIIIEYSADTLVGHLLSLVTYIIGQNKLLH